MATHMDTVLATMALLTALLMAMVHTHTPAIPAMAMATHTARPMVPMAVMVLITALLVMAMATHMPLHTVDMDMATHTTEQQQRLARGTSYLHRVAFKKTRVLCSLREKRVTSVFMT